MAAMVSASMALWSCHWVVTRRSRTISGRAWKEGGEVGGEGFEWCGDVWLGADAEDDVPGVGPPKGFGFSVAVELGVVDFEEVAFGVPADRVDLVAEVQCGEVLGH